MNLKYNRPNLDENPSGFYFISFWPARFVWLWRDRDSWQSEWELHKDGRALLSISRLGTRIC